MQQHEPVHVCSFESRRASDMRSLIERNGGVATVAPSMQEVALESNSEALAFGDAVIAAKIDIVVFLTGVGARAVLETIATRYPRDEIRKCFQAVLVVVRGPKPVAVLREWDIVIDHRAPEPNTWREVITVLDEAGIDLAGRTVAVQEYGRPNPELYTELSGRGASVYPVPVYCWALPDDTGPLRSAIRSIVDERFDVLMFTSANQVRNVLTVAQAESIQAALLAAAARCLVASIGPACSEELQANGFDVGFEASPPKMGQLVRGAIEAARSQ